MRATVITDASYCDRTGAAGWACWIAGDGITSKQECGAFKTLMKSSFDAELYAVINGIYHAAKLGFTVLLVQTDCLGIITAKSAEITGIISDWEKTLGVVVTLRHVKGHTDSQIRKEAKYYCNRWCDKNAKKMMRQKRLQNKTRIK